MIRSKLLLGCLVVLFSIGGWADTVNFTPASSGSLGVSSKTYGPITATAYVLDNNGVWQLSTLWGRNDGSPEQGLGVCSEGASCSRGGGDYNELSNEQNLELIVLTLDPGYSWVSVGLGSLDENSSNLPEQGVIFSGNTSDPNTVDASLFCEFAGGGGVALSCTNSGGAAPTIGFGPGVSSSSLFILPADWNGNNSNNNDFLVRSAVIQPVPEPASLLLLGSGLVGLAGRMRRRFI